MFAAMWKANFTVEVLTVAVFAPGDPAVVTDCKRIVTRRDDWCCDNRRLDIGDGSGVGVVYGRDSMKE